MKRFATSWAALLGCAMVFSAAAQTASLEELEARLKREQAAEAAHQTKAAHREKAAPVTSLDGIWMAENVAGSHRYILELMGSNCSLQGFGPQSSAQMSCRIHRNGSKVNIISKVVSSTSATWSPDNFFLEWDGSNQMSGRLVSAVGADATFIRH